MPIPLRLHARAVGGNKHLLLLDLLLFLLFLVITPIVFLYPLPHISRQNPADQEEPEHIHRLQTRQQKECNDLADPALVLLGIPVEGEAAHGREFVGGERDAGDADGREAVEDAQVDEVAQVAPEEEEEDEEGDCYGAVEVVEAFGGLGMR